jgi:hypothetical protein
MVMVGTLTTVVVGGVVVRGVRLAPVVVGLEQL